MARGRALQDLGVAPEEYRGAAAADPGGAAHAACRRVARTADGRRRAVRPGADPQPNQPPPPSARGGGRRRDRSPRRRSAAPGPGGGALLTHAPRNPARRPPARRTHERNSWRARLFGRRDRGTPRRPRHQCRQLTISCRIYSDGPADAPLELAAAVGIVQAPYVRGRRFLPGLAAAAQRSGEVGRTLFVEGPAALLAVGRGLDQERV